MDPFRALYDEYFPFVWRSLRRLGVAEDDVSDAVQEVFVIVHRKLPTFEGRSKMTTWLFSIAMRVAHDRRKRACVRHEIAMDRLPEPATTNDDSEARETRALALSILDEMPTEQRTAFVLFELEGMSGEEIAELLEVPVGTVRSRLRLARKAFRHALERHRARERFSLRMEPA